MKKIIFAILLIFISTGVLFSAMEEIEDIKNKISTIEEEISFLEKEISRDKDITSWVQNNIALSMTRDLLNRDLPEKGKILSSLRENFGDEIKNETGFIEQNIEKEKEIASGVQIDIGAIKYAQAYIQESLPRKDDLLKVLKGILEELKVKLEKAEEERKNKGDRR